MPAADAREQELMVASIGPSGTRTRPGWCSAWASCWSRFPRRTASCWAALYLPVAWMLIGLMLRGSRVRIPHEGRRLAPRAVELAVLAGVVSRFFCAGFTLGRTSPDSTPAGDYRCSRSFVGASLFGGYVLLGATWLILKTRACCSKALGLARWGSCGLRSAGRGL